MKKLIFILGVAVGYVIGSKRGRSAYENLKSRASDLWQSPTVQRRVDDVQNVVRDKAPAAADTVDQAVAKADDAAADAQAADVPAEELPGNV
jgi:hypothetical protein